MSRANVQDFINDANAIAGVDAVLNADGSVTISVNGVVAYPRVLWNISWGTVSVFWMPGPCSKDGSTGNTTPTGFCEVTDSPNALSPLYGKGYPTDSVTFVDAGVATTAAAQFFLDGLS